MADVDLDALARNPAVARVSECAYEQSDFDGSDAETWLLSFAQYIAEAMNATPALIAELRQHRARVCEWAEDEDGIWHAACGGSFWFDTDGPAENKMRFCPYCGATLLVKS